MHIRKILKTGTPENEFDRNLVLELLSAWRELSLLLNGGLKVSDNFDADIVDVSDSGSADTEFTVAHDLKKVPNGFLVFNIDKGGIVYDSGTSWTTTAIYLKCSVANAAIKVCVL